MALDDVEHGRELVAAHGALFPVGELNQYLVEGSGPAVVDEPGDGHRLTSEHRQIADLPLVHGHGDVSPAVYRAARGQSGKRQRGAVSFWPRKRSTARASSTNSAARLSCSCSM